MRVFKMELSQSLSSEPFLSNVFVNISNHLEVKLKALRPYEMEMREGLHSRSIEHVQSLVAHRGSSLGCKAAEAFMLVRFIR